MTTRLREYSQTASGNNSTNVGGVNFSENQLPSTVNNSARQAMANLRSWYDPTEGDWIDWSATHSVASQTTFKLAGDQTALFVQGRRVRHRGGSAVVYSTVLSASFTAETTITVEDKSGSLSASMSIVGLALAPVAMPRRVDKLDVSGTLSVGSLVVGNGFTNLTVAGSATLSGTVTMLTALNVSGTLSVGGASLLGNLTVAGSATISGTVTIKTAMSVSGNVRAGGALLVGPSAVNAAMAAMFSNDGMSIAGAGATNSYSVSVGGFVAAATSGGYGAWFVGTDNTGPSRVIINGNGPYSIFTSANVSVTASAMVAGRLYQFWFQGGVLHLLNPTVP